MRGHVRKRGTSWTAIYDEARAEDGKRVQRWRGGFVTKREAERFLADTVSSLGDGSYVAPSKVTMAEYLEEWLAEIADSVRPLTYKRYREVVRGHLIPHLGRLTLQGVKRTHVLALYVDLKAAGLAPATISVVHIVLGRALKDAVASDLLIRNVASTVKAPRSGPTKAQAWTARELRTFLEHVADDRLAAFWRLAAMTGMRRGELLGLQWRNVDLEGGRLTVEQQLSPGLALVEPKTANSRRTIALDAATIDVLRAHRDVQRLERDFLAAAYTDRDLVFAREDGEGIHPRIVSEAFLKHGKVAGVSRLTFHGLRHTATTLMLTSGIPLHVVAARIGDRPETVLATYAHLLPRSDAEAADRIAALV